MVVNFTAMKGLRIAEDMMKFKLSNLEEFKVTLTKTCRYEIIKIKDRNNVE